LLLFYAVVQLQHHYYFFIEMEKKTVNHTCHHNINLTGKLLKTQFIIINYINEWYCFRESMCGFL